MTSVLLMLKEMYAQEGIHCDTCTDAAELMELIRRKEYSLASDGSEYAGYIRLRVTGTATHLQCEQFEGLSR